MSDASHGETVALRCSGIVKTFGQNAALKRAELSVSAGTIHALVGENGAGKSTLINIVSGLLIPDNGAVEIFGARERFGSPLEAAAAGIGMVHQHFLLAEALTVAENVALGQRRSPAGWKFDRRRADDEVSALAAQTGLQVNPKARVADLPVGLRQRVEILKALSRGARILLLDEPTAVLAPPEIETLFETLRALRSAGRTIVIVTHKLDEVFALASDVTVLRAGQTVFAGPLAGLSPSALAEKMVGHELAVLESGVLASGVRESVLELRDIRIGSALQIDVLNVRAGEIVGVAGVEGNGQQELADLIAGNFDAAYIPADRHREGLVLEMTLAENLHLRQPPVRRMAKLNLLDRSEMAGRSASLLREYGVAPPLPQLPAYALSGGNQQKLVVARELSRRPKLILACNPTRGLDVGAASEVHNRLLSSVRKEGAGVLLISSDLDEVLLLSDRVLALYRGRLREIGPRGVSKAAVGRAMAGL